jgi:hypothetical protein
MMSCWAVTCQGLQPCHGALMIYDDLLMIYDDLLLIYDSLRGSAGTRT